MGETQKLLGATVVKLRQATVSLAMSILPFSWNLRIGDQGRWLSREEFPALSPHSVVGGN